MYKKLRDIAVIFAFVLLVGAIVWVAVFYGMPWDEGKSVDEGIGGRWLMSWICLIVSMGLAFMAVEDIYKYVMKREDY